MLIIVWSMKCLKIVSNSHHIPFCPTNSVKVPRCSVYIDMKRRKSENLHNWEAETNKWLINCQNSCRLIVCRVINCFNSKIYSIFYDRCVLRFININEKVRKNSQDFIWRHKSGWFELDWLCECTSQSYNLQGTPAILKNVSSNKITISEHFLFFNTMYHQRHNV